jgi:hypothetical protein
VDSVYQHVLAWREALEEAGIELAGWSIHRRIGMSGGLFMNALMREIGRQVTAEEAAHEEHELFERESHGKVTDANRERLRRLRSRWTNAGTCFARDGCGGRRGSIRTKHGVETRKPSRDTRPDDA